MPASTEDTFRIFLSYRRDDCSMHAGRLADNLRDRGIAEVFIDVDGIQLGESFPDRIDREIAQCDAMVVMIGDDWLTLPGPDGKPRINSPNDWVALEVAAALKRGLPVIPVLVEGASVPQEADLPEAIRELSFRTGIDLRDATWRHDFERFASALPGAVHRASTAEQRSQGGPTIDFAAARSFIESIPRGRWASYSDVAAAGGSPKDEVAVLDWLRTRGEVIPNVWRVLSAAGEVDEEWSSEATDVPGTPDEVRLLLFKEGLHTDGKGHAAESARWTLDDGADAGAALSAPSDERSSPARVETDTLIVAGRKAYPDYLLSSSYICQQGRSFRRGVERMGFYSEREIKREIPRILHRRDDVVFSLEAAAQLRQRGQPFDAEVAQLVQQALDPAVPWQIKRQPGEPKQVFLLTDPEGEDTLLLPAPIHHGGRSAWTQSQRYAVASALRNAQDTDQL